MFLGVRSALWLLAEEWGRPVILLSILEDWFSVGIVEVSFAIDRRLSTVDSSMLSCRSSFDGLLVADCCPRGMFFINGIHRIVSNLLASVISVCRRSSTRRSVYFFKQSTSALRLRWLRGDRDGLRCPLLTAGPALSLVSNELWVYLEVNQLIPYPKLYLEKKIRERRYYNSI
jgi:hypothetical protein